MEDDVLAVLDQVGRGRAKTNHLGGGGECRTTFFRQKGVVRER